MRASALVAGVVLVVACVLTLPAALSAAAFCLGVAVGPATTLLARHARLPWQQAVPLGVCGNLSVLLLGAELMLLLHLWHPSVLLVVYAALVAAAGQWSGHVAPAPAPAP